MGQVPVEAAKEFVNIMEKMNKSETTLEVGVVIYMSIIPIHTHSVALESF